MSSSKSYLYNNSFDSYNELIVNVLKERGLTQKWLLENIIEEGQKKNSLQSQISRWFSQKKVESGEFQPVSTDYQAKINNALNIEVNRNSDGKWEVSRTDDPTTKKINRLKQKVDAEGVDYAAQVQILEYLEGRTESLSQELSEISAMMKKLRASMFDPDD